MAKATWIGVAFLGLCVYGCSGPETTAPTTPVYSDYYSEMMVEDGNGESVTPPQFDEDRVRGDAYADVMAEDYQQTGIGSGGEGHEAGFEWAKSQQLTDKSQCSGNSDSFVEGCEQFFEAVEDEIETRRDDFNGEFNTNYGNY